MPEDPNVMLEKLRIQVDQLKVQYERYFLGLDRRQPLRQHEELRNAIRKLRAKPPPRNTAVKFKLNSLISKFTTFDRYWERILKEMEDGRFTRDNYKVAKKKRNEDMLSAYAPNAAKKKQKTRLRAEGGGPGKGREGEQEKAPAPVPAGGEGGSQTATARAPKPPGPPPAGSESVTARQTPTRRPAARPGTGPIKPDKLERAFKTYVAARKKTGEATQNLSYNKVMKQFANKLPDFMERHKCKDVELKVVIQKGKAKIKAVPIK